MTKSLKLQLDDLKLIKDAQDSLFEVMSIIVINKDHQIKLECGLAVLDRLYCIYADNIIRELLDERGD